MSEVVVNLEVSRLKLVLPPVSAALGAHEDEVESIACRLREGDRRRVLAAILGADDVVRPLESRVLHAVLVDLELEDRVCALVLGVVLLVDAGVPLVVLSRPLEVGALAALEDEASDALPLVVDLLLGVEHVVALLAEAHAAVDG